MSPLSKCVRCRTFKLRTRSLTLFLLYDILFLWGACCSTVCRQYHYLDRQAAMLAAVLVLVQQPVGSASLSRQFSSLHLLRTLLPANDPSRGLRGHSWAAQRVDAYHLPLERHPSVRECS
ncbi:hypothetical protein BU24DRAFT_418248 [Aaosphaeria arxii CBS 175.79]|uniref:Uncharacterized protein n=1 Tax=Aaosphaeria arxii CBS 175.79 TaxID=1450172 RepID=A0A6A5Y1B4_9PLEO|nr:uncharacterized protein BU24DRAFT_418248 [Aaosphaeria arxii CBS 175.79]KAF2018711.1 hypothetical protein BU24DRAFT_418248 [Aaosphaeria arxii CBS 175.79]